MKKKLQIFSWNINGIRSAHKKGLVDVFGVSHVFLTPHQKNFPLMGLPGKKVAFLDEWRFNDAIVSYPEQMQWFVAPTRSPDYVGRSETCKSAVCYPAPWGATGWVGNAAEGPPHIALADCA